MKNFLFYFIFLTLFASAASAQHVVQLNADHGLEHIAQYAGFFRDTAGTLTIEQVSTLAFRNNFIPTGKTQTNLSITRSVIWIHFRLTSDDIGPWCVQAEHPLTDNMQLYHKTETGWDVSKAGYDFPFTERELCSNVMVFPLKLHLGDTTEYFLRIQSVTPIFIVLRAGTTKDFWAQQLLDSLFAGLFFGIMLIMMLYNLFLFITNRDSVYIFYVLYVFFCTIFISLTNGYAIFLPDFIRQIYQFNHLIFPSVFGYFGLFFTMRFLYTKRYAPRLTKFIYLFMVMVGIIITIGFFDEALGLLMIQVAGLLLTVLSLVIGFSVLKAGYAPARYYLFGFGIYMLGLCAYIVIALANVDMGNLPPHYILMAGSALEAIILSFAIGDKLNIAVHDKQIAQEEKLKAVSLNEQLVREQNVILERKVEARTHEITLQKDIIEEKNKDILSSIHYAKRIQRALLASDSLLANNLPEHFLVYKPKDIVSGDFYWAGIAPDRKFLVLTGDCTGHGVPGAFMSLLNISIMHELTFAHNLSRPDLLLNAQRDAIIMALNPEGTNEISKDGMDAVLCSYDFQNRKLEFACANNPLWIIRNKELIEFRPDKQPIGLHEGPKADFKLHEVQLMPGDIIYTFTDGYADQFGGPKGKKFKLSQLKEKLLSICEKPMSEQKDMIEKNFEEWKGELEQVDDVLIVGVKIK
ncbi:MAG: 7TM diverse intracellular signaling domain-containing protein [Bacteroidia bacterium]